MNKKAVSPLIAVVLLIVVVVGIGAILGSIIKDSTSKSQEVTGKNLGSISCSTDINFNIVDLEGAQVCKTDTYIEVVIENFGETIGDFAVDIFTDSAVVSNSSAGKSVQKGETAALTFSYEGVSKESITEIRVIPKVINSKGEYTFCQGVSVQLPVLALC